MRKTLGQTVVIENVTGASGSVAGVRAARATPDGYTIIIGHWGTHVLNGAVYSLQYDVLNDFVEFYRHVVVGDGTLAIVEILPGVAAIVVGSGIVRLEAERLGMIRDRLIEQLQATIGIATASPGQRRVWIVAKRFREIRQREFVFAKAPIHAAALQVNQCAVFIAAAVRIDQRGAGVDDRASTSVGPPAEN